MLTVRRSPLDILFVISCSAFVGNHALTWTDGAPLPGFNAGIALNGWADVNASLTDSDEHYGGLVGAKYLSVRDCNVNGRWTAAALHRFDYAVKSGRLAHYTGICYGFEEGDAYGR